MCGCLAILIQVIIVVISKKVVDYHHTQKLRPNSDFKKFVICYENTNFRSFNLLRQSYDSQMLIFRKKWCLL
jgi:hypothetical protein